MIGLSSFIRFHALRSPDRPALVYAGRRITYAELMRRIEITAGWLAARGIGPGDVVALLMKNSAAFIELALAVSHIGAVLLPINFRLAQDEVAFILDHAGDANDFHIVHRFIAAHPLANFAAVNVG